MVQQLEYRSTKPRDMWKHIAQRQPVVINGVDKVWDKLTDDLLIDKAGDVTVMVEQRSSTKEAYGQGRKAPMQLAQLIAEVQKGNSELYMSTQEVAVGHDGHPLLFGPPLVQLIGEFPIQQPLMGNLVPQSINMWMGCAPEGSSTGLHHDFHENLYVLLRGCKRFRLYPPEAAPDMYVRGRIKCIYPNGRIVYEGQGDILPDGSDQHDVHLWQARHDADKAAAAAAAAAEPSHADAADAILEQQLERMLDEGAEMCALRDLEDDYIDSDEPADLSEDGYDGDPSEEMAWESDRKAAGDKINWSSAKKRQRKGLGQHREHQHHHHHHHHHQQQQQQQPQFKKKKLLDACQYAAAHAGSGSKAAGAKPGVLRALEPPPPSFSQVDLLLPESVLRKKFPRFPGVGACQEVLLQAGQMLYMPAGWFHEVTSFGGAGLDGGHLAINYWYHPPDNLDSSKAGFKHPYTSPYYPTIWRQRQRWLLQETQQCWEHKQKTSNAAAAAAGGGGEITGEHAAAVVAAAGADTILPHTLHVNTARSGKHIAWDAQVHSPTNKYTMSMTKHGTATADAGRSSLSSNQAGGRLCRGMIGCTDGDGGTELDLPCSSREQSPAGPAVAAMPKQQQQRAGCKQHAPHHAGTCTLRHAPATSGATLQGPDAAGQALGAGKGASAAVGRTRARRMRAAAKLNQQHNGPSYVDWDDEDEQSLSNEVQDGISAVEDYFSDNPEAMKALLAEFMQQRRRRLVAASRAAAAGSPTVLALPRLFGRRHHHYAVLKMVPRKPARR